MGLYTVCCFEPQPQNLMCGFPVVRSYATSLHPLVQYE